MTTPTASLSKVDERAARYRVLAVTWLAYASYYVGRKGLSVSKTTLQGELSMSAPVLAALDTAYLSAYAVGQVPSGLLADRRGARPLIAFGMLLSALACAGFGAASHALPMLLWMAVNGLAQSSGWPSTTKAIAEHTSALDRGRIMGAWSTCYQVGGIAATALCTFLLAHYGFRWAFFGPALWLLVIALVVYVALPKQVPSATVTTRGMQPARAEQPGLLEARPSDEPPRSVFREPVLYCYGACYFCLKLIRYSLLFWLPYYLETAAGFERAQSGYLSTAFEIGGVAGSFGLGYLSDRASGDRAKVAAGSLLGLACALFAYAQLGAEDAWLHVAGMALIGALLFGPDALLSGAAAQDIGGRQQAATAVGIVNGLGSAGALLQGALTVSVQTAFGWQALFHAFVGLSLFAVLCLVPAFRTRASRVGG